MDLTQSIPSYIKSLMPYKAGLSMDELKRQKIKKISKLASNENPYGPSPIALDEMKNALSEIYYYPDMYGLKIKEAIAKLYGLKKENILLGNGSESVLSLISRAFLLPGDHVLSSEISFISTTTVVRATGANIQLIPLTRDYRFDVEKIKDNLSKNTKMLYIANPNNPTGTYINKKEWSYLMDYVSSSTLVVMDEAYFEFAKECEDYPDSLQDDYDNVITMRTFSKAYGLAGIRLGYALAHQKIIEVMDKIRPAFEANQIAQRGAIAALNDREHLQKVIAKNQKQYKRTYEFLNKLNFNSISSFLASNFICFKTASSEAAEWLFSQLLQKGVVVRDLPG
ncbi:MAG: histidinol-phosphate transaminase, partial [Halobacteriovoraceae bacterium]|nr:histidinol-phosphate transaminase [Halobacteriovoraceae bacterium]